MRNLSSLLSSRATRRSRYGASVLAIAVALVAGVGCHRNESPTVVTVAAHEPSASPVRDPEHSKRAPLGSETGPEIAGTNPALPSPSSEDEPELATGPTLEDLADTPKDDKDGDDEEKDPEERKDYWEKIPFTMANFEEVLEYVKTYYIEDKIDVSRAYIEAAAFALGELDPPRELVPEAFYEARKGLAEEEGGLDGKTYKIHKDDKYLVLTPKPMDEAKLKERQKKRLSDEEIRTKRLQLDARRKLFEAEWEKIPFNRAEFDDVLADIKEAIKGTKQETEAKGDPLKRFVVAAAQGYLYSLDPHSSLVSAEAWDESTKSTTDSSFEGIGAILTQQNDETLVESPLEGRPAASAGVRAGDRIIRVDGKEIAGLPLHKVVKRIRGPLGSKVTLTVMREGEPDEKQFVLERARIVITNVQGRLLGEQHPGIAYFKVAGFVPDTAEHIKQTIERLAEENAKLHNGAPLRGLVFDLRNNSGGLLAQGVQVADLFLEAGKIVEVRSRTKREETYTAHSEGTLDLPLIVLVNDGSASASEIVASAIQDNARGLIVGDRTFGKASVQTLFTPVLRKDYYIKLTIARYFSPVGRTIQVTGVQPDFEVPVEVGKPMPLGFREENLSHFLKALDEDYKKPKVALAEKIKVCADERGVAEKMHASDPHPQIKFDYQLMKGADYMECYIDALKESRGKKDK